MIVYAKYVTLIFREKKSFVESFATPNSFIYVQFKCNLPWHTLWFMRFTNLAIFDGKKLPKIEIVQYTLHELNGMGGGRGGGQIS